MSIKEIKKTVYVCDLCGAEHEYKLGVCSKCGAEICSTCTVSYHFEARKHKPSGNNYDHLHFIEVGYECGLFAQYCDKCAVELDTQLIALGFKTFKHDESN